MATNLIDARQFSTDWIAGTSRRRTALLTCCVVFVSLVLIQLILQFDLAALAFLGVWIGVIAIVIQPRFGLYAMFALVLLFEPNSADPLMGVGAYLNNSLQTSFNVSGLILIPLELLLLLTTSVWLAKALMNRRAGFVGGVSGRPMLFFCLVLVFSVVRGLAGGAIFNFAFWESRYLFWMVLAYVLASNTIKTRAHVRTLLTIIMVCVSFSSLDGVWRKFALIDAGLLGPAQETWYSHESVVIWGLLIMLVFAQLAFGGATWQRLIGPIMLFITGFTMLVSERRAGYIAVMVAFIAFAFVLGFSKRKAFFLICVPIILATAVYLPVFWNNTGTFGQPARAVRSLRDPDPRDAASNLSRDLEAINVRATIASDPILGVGFGRPFLQVVAVPDISFFPFWNYEAHHDILWVWMKTGAFGFTLFFVVMGRGLSRAAALTRSLRERDGKVFALLALCAMVMSLVFCYVDLGLTGGRIPVVLGTMLGTVGVLDRIYE